MNSSKRTPASDYYASLMGALEGKASVKLIPDMGGSFVRVQEAHMIDSDCGVFIFGPRYSDGLNKWVIMYGDFGYGYMQEVTMCGDAPVADVAQEALRVLPQAQAAAAQVAERLN